jgi:hypothetical protein
MSFLDDVTAETRTNGTSCKTCRILDTLPPKERAEVEPILADHNFTSEAIARAMRRRGWEVSGNGIRNHRRNCLPTN